MSFISKLFGPEPVAVSPPTPRVPKVQFIEKDMEISAEVIELVYTNAQGKIHREYVWDKVDAFSGYHTLDDVMELIHLYKVAGDLQFLRLDGEPCVIVPQVIPMEQVARHRINTFGPGAMTIRRSDDEVELFYPVKVKMLRQKRAKKQGNRPEIKIVTVLAAMVTYE